MSNCIAPLLNKARNAVRNGDSIFDFKAIEKVDEFNKHDRIKALTELFKVFRADVDDVALYNHLQTFFDWFDERVIKEIKDRLRQK